MTKVIELTMNQLEVIENLKEVKTEWRLNVLATELNIAPNTFSNYFAWRSRPKGKTLVKLQEYFNNK